MHTSTLVNGMILKLRLGNVRFTMTIAKVIDMLGVNSKLKDGNHILMWDFDNANFEDVVNALTDVSLRYGLPQIRILLSSPPNNYIAYCFKRCSWAQARQIVGETMGIDENFYKWGVFRRRFTLRVGKKCGVLPMYIGSTHGETLDDVHISELTSWVKYETLDSHHKQFAKYVELP